MMYKRISVRVRTGESGHKKQICGCQWMERGESGLIVVRYGVSFWSDENVQELGSDDGYVQCALLNGTFHVL